MDKCVITKLLKAVNDSSLPKLGDAIFELLGNSGRINKAAGASIRVLSGSITCDDVTYSAGDTFTAAKGKTFSGTSGSRFAIEGKYDGIASLLAGGTWRLVNTSDLAYINAQTTGLKNAFTVDELLKINQIGNSDSVVFGVSGAEPTIEDFSDIANIRVRWLENVGTYNTLFTGPSTWSSTSLRNTSGTHGLFTRNCEFASGTDVDNYLINQAACSLGILLSSGYNTINLTTSDSTDRTSASDEAVAAIKTAGGTLTINGVEQ